MIVIFKITRFYKQKNENFRYKITKICWRGAALLPREGGYGGADYGEGGAHEDDPTQDELSRQRRQRHDEIPDTRYLVHSTTDHVVVQRGMSVDAFVGVAAGDQFAVFVKVSSTR